MARAARDPMASTLTWLDFFEAERRRALEVLEAFSQTETRDRGLVDPRSGRRREDSR